MTISDLLDNWTVTTKEFHKDSLLKVINSHYFTDDDCMEIFSILNDWEADDYFGTEGFNL